jgi:hypothetical protein
MAYSIISKIDIDELIKFIKESKIIPEQKQGELLNKLK